MMRSLLLVGLTALLSTPVHSLRVACNEMWIEHTPIPYAINNFYKADTATLVNGGVANLGDSTIDLAANAETQGIPAYVRNKDVRLIGIIVEVAYRLVANKAAGTGIRTLADLKGKRVGTMSGTSADVFVHRLLASAGLSQTTDYTTVNGGVCMRAPCGAGTLPQQLTSGQVDAFGIWETTVELGVEALGSNAIVFQNASVYREVYSLYSTAAKLADAGTRRKIVQFVRALNQTYEVFTAQPSTVYATVAQMVGVDVPVLEKVWGVHKWGPGSLGADLVDFLVYEDQYLAKTSGRQALSRADLAAFVDASVYQDAMKG